MATFTATRRRSLSVPPGAHPGSNALSVEIRLSVPAGVQVTPDDVSRILTSAVVEIAEEFGAEFCAVRKVQVA